MATPAISISYVECGSLLRAKTLSLTFVMGLKSLLFMVVTSSLLPHFLRATSVRLHLGEGRILFGGTPESGAGLHRTAGMRRISPA
jgi:hypothetical protein